MSWSSTWPQLIDCNYTRVCLCHIFRNRNKTKYEDLGSTDACSLCFCSNSIFRGRYIAAILSPNIASLRLLKVPWTTHSESCRLQESYVHSSTSQPSMTFGRNDAFQAPESHLVIWFIQYYRWVPQQYTLLNSIHSLQHMYFNDKVSRTLKSSNGLLQCSVIASRLFNLYIQEFTCHNLQRIQLPFQPWTRCSIN